MLALALTRCLCPTSQSHHGKHQTVCSEVQFLELNKIWGQAAWTQFPKEGKGTTVIALSLSYPQNTTKLSGNMSKLSELVAFSDDESESLEPDEVEENEDEDKEEDEEKEEEEIKEEMEEEIEEEDKLGKFQASGYQKRPASHSANQPRNPRSTLTKTFNLGSSDSGGQPRGNFCSVSS